MSADSSPSSLVPPPPILPPSPPELPVEMIQHILKFADARALALCCQGNFALLELASKLLYGAVEVVGEDKLVQMFCSRNQTSSPRLEPFSPSLESLPSPSRPRQEPSLPPSPRIESPTIPTASPSPSKSTCSSSRSSTDPSLNRRPSTPSPSLQHSSRSSIPPSSTSSSSLPPAPSRIPISASLSTASVLHVWDRLTYVKLVDTSFEDRLNTWKHFPNTSSWSVSYELSKPFNTGDPCSAEFGDAFLDLTKMSLKDSGWFPNQKINRAEVVVQSEEERVEIEKYFRSLGRIYLGEPGELDERMEKVTFVCRKIHS